METAIAGLTGPGGAFPLYEADIAGRQQTVIGGLPENLRDFIALAASHGEMDCFVDGDRRFSYTEVMRLVAALAAVLANRYGIMKGDRVAIAMRNCPEWCISFMAAVTLGAVAVPMNSWWQGEELAYALEDSAARLAFLDGPRHSRVAGWLAESGLPVIGVDTGDETLPDDVPLLVELMADHSGDFPDTEIHSEDLAVILYTSGSTGLPKGVYSSQRNVLSALGAWLILITAVNSLSEKAENQQNTPLGVLLTLPLFHVTGLHSLFLLSLIIGRKIVMMRKWDVDRALELIQSERITHFNGVPTMSMELMNHPRLGEFDTSSLVDISAGGAARPAEQVKTIAERFPNASPSVGYGLTETNAVGCVSGEEDYLERPGSVGRPMAPLIQLKIVDSAGTELPQGATGEIWIRSPAVAGGYWNLPDETAQTFVDGWCRTGDVAFQDDDGFVYIVDRLKDIIIRGGENISCLEVEEGLYTHPEVEEAAVFGLPDGRLGEIVGAAVKTRSGKPIEIEGMREFLAKRMAAYKLPVHLWCHTEKLPRIASGKIDKKAIRNALTARLSL